MTLPCPKCGTDENPLIIRFADGRESVTCKKCENQVLFLPPNEADKAWAQNWIDKFEKEEHHG